MYEGEKMSIIFDKIILFFLGMLTFLFISITPLSVICVLIALAISSLIFYFNSPKITSILAIIYICFCVIHPVFYVFLPLLLYDLFYIHLKYMVVLTLFMLLPYWFRGNMGLTMISVFGVFLSYLLQKQTMSHTKLKEEYKMLRDTSKELHLYLSKENRMLIENQNYEIHLATLQERNRIAREIHDNVGHMLSRSLLQVGALITTSQNDTLTKHLSDIKDTLNSAMNSIRESVHDLHDDSIDLYTNIKDMIDNFQDYKITLDYDISEHVSKDIKYCFIMIIKEALSNTAKHSNANEITMIIREHPVFYQLLIKDNGSHLKQRELGMGLENMKIRVKNLNGNISFEQSNGFQIFVSIPKSEKGGIN